MRWPSRLSTPQRSKDPLSVFHEERPEPLASSEPLCDGGLLIFDWPPELDGDNTDPDAGGPGRRDDFHGRVEQSLCGSGQRRPSGPAELEIGLSAPGLVNHAYTLRVILRKALSIPEVDPGRSPRLETGLLEIKSRRDSAIGARAGHPHLR